MVRLLWVENVNILNERRHRLRLVWWQLIEAFVAYVEKSFTWSSSKLTDRKPIEPQLVIQIFLHFPALK